MCVCVLVARVLWFLRSLTRYERRKKKEMKKIQIFLDRKIEFTKLVMLCKGERGKERGERASRD